MCWSTRRDRSNVGNHWEKTSHALLVGAILHVLCAEPDKTLAGVANFLSDPKRTIDDLGGDDETAHLGEAGTHPVVASAARELLNKSDNRAERRPLHRHVVSRLYRDPVVARVTRIVTGRISDLVENDDRRRSTWSCHHRISAAPSHMIR